MSDPVDALATPEEPSRAEVLDACGELYRPEGVAIWMQAPNRMLGGQTPDAMVASGEGRRVLDLINALCEGVIF